MWEQQGKILADSTTLKIPVFLNSNLQHDDCSKHCCMVYVQVKSANPKSSHYKKKYYVFLPFCFFVSTEMMDVN